MFILYGLAMISTSRMGLKSPGIAHFLAFLGGIN
jgi:hypothetical protein